MNIDRSILCFVLAALLAVCQCQKAEKYTAQNPCISKQTCGDCIQTHSCAWCFQPEFGDRPRCFQPSMDSANGRCDEKFVYNPDNLISALQNKSLSRGKWSASGSVQQTETSSGSSQSSAAAAAAAAAAAEVVQISPQRVRLELRRNEAQKLTIKYAQAQDYPVDLYYLMDLSKSMENDKEKLSALGDLLANTMRNITSNFRLGFGSFVDKVVMPFVSTVPKNLEHPCDGCVKPYGFKNEMQLSTDTFRFSSAVKHAQVSGNLDAPEGGFDAIMQAVVCKQEIGWRDKARRLLVFSTDAGFHYAGDGKLGGIVQPNDGACHMENGSYSYSTIQDYPSISHINLKVKQESINVIFAVTQEQISVYEQLRAHIEGASSGVLSNDSSNVVDFIKDQYNKISSAVEMKDNSKGEVKITYHSSCLGGGSLVETNRCEGLKVGDEVHFEAEITVTECPADRSQWTQTFQIYPVGISESLTVELQMLCDCPCERPGHPMYEEHAVACSSAGLLACGVCKCEPGRFGRRCECSAAGGGAGGAELANACRPLNATSGVECSGRGSCVCGQCECQKLPNPLEEITGQFCECDNFSCDRNSNMLCSGPQHGTCVCGQCVCNEGWSGPACDCRSLNDSCIAPGSTEVCSGHGSCKCGQCVCNTGSEGEAHYAGRFCETCTTCPGRCVEFKECVLCQHYKLYGESKPEKECNETCNYEIIPVNTVIQDESKGEHICTYRTEDGCNYSYKYYYNETNKVYIEVQDKLDCSPPLFILGILLGVIAAIVLVGLALLMLWKMVTTIHDRREFARFEKERMMAKWDTGENPIYKQATSTFKNPTYAGK